MKKYYSLGELIKDYREVYNISQTDLSIKVNADIRTIQRWEKDQTNIKAEKELEFVRATLLPFQLIRNLNAFETIPTFYDFKIRKYSLSKLTNDFPNAFSLKYKYIESTNRIRSIDAGMDIEYIMEYMHFDESYRNEVFKMLREACIQLPELNLIISDEYGNYSGHSLMLPIRLSDYNRIKNKEIDIEDLTPSDLVNSKIQDYPVFLNYDVTADCNDNLYYLIDYLFQYFKNIPQQDYLFSSFVNRYDTIEFTKQIGLKTIWEESELHDSPIWTAPKKLIAGNFKSYLKNYI